MEQPCFQADLPEKKALVCVAPRLCLYTNGLVYRSCRFTSEFLVVALPFASYHTADDDDDDDEDLC